MLSDDMLADFCGYDCWSEAEPSIVSTLQLAFQPFHMVASCSVCLRPVDRRAPHVTMNIAEFEAASQPWLISARVLDEREIAVFCPACAQPGRSSDVSGGVVEGDTVENAAVPA